MHIYIYTYIYIQNESREMQSEKLSKNIYRLHDLFTIDFWKVRFWDQFEYDIQNESREMQSISFWITVRTISPYLNNMDAVIVISITIIIIIIIM